MRKFYLLCIYCLLSFINPSNLHSATLTLYTEEFPPFQYSDDLGGISGVSYEIVSTVLQNAGFSYEIKVFPWSRSYAMTQEHKNSLIFSISRRKNREQLFKWIGRIVPVHYSVFSLPERSDIHLSALEDMTLFSIGTTRNDAREAYLLNNGIKLVNFDRTSGDNPHQINYRKLKAGRFDLWPMPDAVAFHIVKSFGDNPADALRRVLPLEDISRDGYYLAANLQTDDAIIFRIRSALTRFKQSDEYLKILENWGVQ